jgi:hypothetical protein
LLGGGSFSELLLSLLYLFLLLGPHLCDAILHLGCQFLPLELPLAFYLRIEIMLLFDLLGRMQEVKLEAAL